MGVTEIGSFELVLEEKTGKEISESSRLEFLEKFSANNLALSDKKAAPPGCYQFANKTLLAICQKSSEPSFRKAMDMFY